MSALRKETEKQLNQTAVLTLDSVGFDAISRSLFQDLSLTLTTGNVIGITGEASTGKSTLLKIIAGQEIAHRGQIYRKRNMQISFVPQTLDQIELNLSTDIRTLFYNARGLDQAETAWNEACQLLSSAGPKSMEIYQNSYDRFEQLGGFTAEQDIAEIITGLDIGREIDLDTKLSELSSGQRTKVLIGQALFAHGDLLVMDDPTSNLDVQSRQWLGKYLRQKLPNTAVVVATKDREFLTQFATEVVELNLSARTFHFQGNLDAFAEKKRAMLEAEETAALALEKKVVALEQTVESFYQNPKVGRSKDMARVRTTLRRRAERDRATLAEMQNKQEPELKPVKLQTFEIARRSGNDVLTLRDVKKTFAEVKALDMAGNVLNIRFGERVGIVGRNGSGKSTLLRAIMDTYFGQAPNLSSGEIHIGQNVDIGYYSPDHLGLDEEALIVDEAKTAMNSIGNINMGKIRAVLQYFGFEWNDVEGVRVAQLGKGEKVQLALAKLMLMQPNLLLLDEPTDGLSKQLQDRLVAALKGYKGTLVIVSHMPEFYKQLAIGRELELPGAKIKIL